MATHKRTSFALLLSLAFSTAASEAAEPKIHAGRAQVYQSLEAGSLEDVTTVEALKTLDARNVNIPPTRIWKLLEHGEKVECLSCIPGVASLLYADSAKTREISAWWLRRRVFGVFGPGEVYSRVLATVADPNETESRRAHAAEAIGEFLKPAGVPRVARAAVSDSSARVRRSAVAALQRLNSEGPNRELGAALEDSEVEVRLAALNAAMSINVFSSVDGVVALLSDSSSLVRRRAAEALGSMRVADSVVGLAALASPASESDADVRLAAVWALGQIADPAGRAAVQAAQSDPSALVRNTASIALRRL